MKNRIFYITFSFVLISMISKSIQAQEVLGLWQNELGSVLVIDSIDLSGLIYGSYRSSSGVDGKEFSLQGWTNKGVGKSIAIAFSVRWNGYSSITNWSGFYDIDSQGPYIKTLWHLVRPDEEEPWERIITNSSLFRPLN